MASAPDRDALERRIADLEAALSVHRAAREAAERDRVISEVRLRETAKREREAIVRIARLSAGSADPGIGAGIAELTETASALLAVERTSVWLLSSDRRSLCCLDLFERSRGAHSAGHELSAHDHPRYFEALESGRAIDGHDAQADPRTSEFRDSYLVPNGITSMMDAAIRRGGHVIGVVCHEHVGPARSWLPNELDFAAALADQVALVLAADERWRLRGMADTTRRELQAARGLARLDALTGLYNRVAMETVLAEEIGRARRYRRPLAVAMIDLDRLKDVNVRFGHQVGDRILHDVSRLVASELRVSDKPTRYGGDELLLILPETDRRQALALSERLGRCVEEHVFLAADAADDRQPSIELRVTVSIGVAVLGDDLDSAEKLVQAAEHALRDLKRAGHDRRPGAPLVG
jgi:two-component system, cell cycle response regulator